MKGFDKKPDPDFSTENTTALLKDITAFDIQADKPYFTIYLITFFKKLPQKHPKIVNLRFGVNFFFALLINLATGIFNKHSIF